MGIGSARRGQVGNKDQCRRSICEQPDEALEAEELCVEWGLEERGEANFVEGARQEADRGWG